MASGSLIFASRRCNNDVRACAPGSPRLEVVDARSHRVLATSQRYSMLAVGDRRLWAADLDASGPRLAALTLHSLTPVGSVRPPGASGVVRAAAVAGADVWAAAGTTLTEVTATSLHVARTLSVGGRITDITASPNGKALWDIVAASGPIRPPEVQLRDPATGAVRGTWRAPPGIARIQGLTADDAGTWVDQAGGMTTDLVRLQGPPLRVTIRGGEPANTGGQAHFDLVGQPITALDADNVLWTDISGQALACDSPTASTTRSETKLPTIGNLTATGPDLIAATPKGIALVRPPAICR
ncbi:MAG: hypothetical protein ACYDEN_10270 [Acidimicrobiales bacterium]